MKTLVERGIDCIFIGYTEHSKAYRFFFIEPNDYVSVNSVTESKYAIFDERKMEVTCKCGCYVSVNRYLPCIKGRWKLHANVRTFI